MIEASDASFAEDVLASEVPVIVGFTAPWCRPCRVIEPFLLDLEREHHERLRLVRLDVDENVGVPSRFGVLTLPTVIVFADGEARETILGLQPRRRYAEAVERVLAL